jgi:hypothetical protein
MTTSSIDNQLDPALITFDHDALAGTIVTGTFSTDEFTDDNSDCGVTGTSSSAEH